MRPAAATDPLGRPHATRDYFATTVKQTVRSSFTGDIRSSTSLNITSNAESSAMVGRSKLMCVAPDPPGEVRSTINADAAYVLHYYRRNGEAIDAARRALDMRPGFPLAHLWLGRIQTEEGRYVDARAALESIGPLRAWAPAMAALGYLEARAGRPDAARRILAEFDGLTRAGRYVSSYAMAVVYAGLNDRERVMALLREAVRERSHWLVWLARDPRWDAMRADPRFAELVRRVGLPPS